MKAKTSVTISNELLKKIDKLSGKKGKRSAFFELAAIEYLDKLRKEARYRREIEIINRNSKQMNRNVEETMKYQADIFEER